MEKKAIQLIIFIFIGGILLLGYANTGKTPPQKETEEEIISEVKFDAIEEVSSGIVLGYLNQHRVVASTEGIFVDEKIQETDTVVLKNNGYYLVTGEKTVLKRNGIIIYEFPAPVTTCTITPYNDGYIVLTYIQEENETTLLIRNRKIIETNIEKMTVYKDQNDIKAEEFWYYGTIDHPKYYTQDHTFYHLEKATIKTYTILDQVTTELGTQYYLLTADNQKYIYQTTNNRLTSVDNQVDYLIGKTNQESTKSITTNKKNNLLVGNHQTGKIGLIDENGNLKIPFQYDNAWIKENYIIFIENEKYGLANLEGKKVLQAQYNWIEICQKYIILASQNTIEIKNSALETLPNGILTVTEPLEEKTLLTNIGEYLHLQIIEESNLFIGNQGPIVELSPNTQVFEQDKEAILVRQETLETEKQIIFEDLQGRELSTLHFDPDVTIEVSKKIKENTVYTIKEYQENTLKKVIYYEINTKKKNIVYDSQEYVNEITLAGVTYNYSLKNNILKLYNITDNTFTLIQNTLNIKLLNEDYAIIEMSDHKWRVLKP